MATSKQTTARKTKQSSKAVMGRGVRSKKSVKVVDVKLSTKKNEKSRKKNPSKTAAVKSSSKKSATKSKSTKATASSKKTPAKKKIQAKQNQSKSKQAAPKAKKSEKPKKKVRKTSSSAKKTLKAASQKSKKNSPEETQTTKQEKTAARREGQLNQIDEMLEMVASPSVEVLRPFRQAAKLNQKIAREKVRARRRCSNFLAKAPRKGKRYLIDLRVHSPATRGYFSPGGVEPAAALVRLARVKGLDLLGLTDYYHGGYVDKVRALAHDSKVRIIPGLDLRCVIGDCHCATISVLFPEETTSGELFRILDELNVPETAYGHSEYCIRKPFSQVVEVLENHQGLIIPTRVDKTPYSQLAIPVLVEKYGIHAFDLVHPENPEFFRKQWPDGEFTFFSFSNANALGQIGNRADRVKLETPDFGGLRSRVQRRLRH